MARGGGGAGVSATVVRVPDKLGAGSGSPASRAFRATVPLAVDFQKVVHAHAVACGDLDVERAHVKLEWHILLDHAVLIVGVPLAGAEVVGVHALVAFDCARSGDNLEGRRAHDRGALTTCVGSVCADGDRGVIVVSRVGGVDELADDKCGPPLVLPVLGQHCPPLDSAPNSSFRREEVHVHLVDEARPDDAKVVVVAACIAADAERGDERFDQHSAHSCLSTRNGEVTVDPVASTLRGLRMPLSSSTAAASIQPSRYREGALKSVLPMRLSLSHSASELCKPIIASSAYAYMACKPFGEVASDGAELCGKPISCPSSCAYVVQLSRVRVMTVVPRPLLFAGPSVEGKMAP
eukprot:scaffold19538_cov66-Phaeocystis_antarctica.AAC.2